MIVTRPINASEPDLLLGHDFETLLFTDLDKNLIKKIEAPITGWSHELLEDELKSISDDVQRCGWDAYLGSLSHWIGSSEV